jgi:hypothetical protein
MMIRACGNSPRIAIRMSMPTKFSHSLHSIGRIGNEKHVRLRGDDRSQSLAKDRVIFYA